MAYSIEIVSQTNYQLGEGPVWDERTQTVWWTDILAGNIYRSRPATDAVERFEVGSHVGTVGLCESGDLLLATARGILRFNPNSSALREIVNPLNGRSHLRFNDGKPDPSGSFYVGTMSYEAEEGAGAFYRMSGGGELTAVLPNVTISNGLAWNKAHTKMYYIDTPTKVVTVFDYDASTGTSTNPQPAFAIPDSAGHPDGMTIDTEDELWIAHYGGSAVRRWNPESGELMESIELPAAQITCCTFGGNNFDTLFVTSASQNLSEEELNAQPLAGAVFAIKMPYQGLPAFRFKG